MDIKDSGSGISGNSITKKLINQNKQPQIVSKKLIRFLRWPKYNHAEDKFNVTIQLFLAASDNARAASKLYRELGFISYDQASLD